MNPHNPLPDPELEHLPPEVREMAQVWHESMSDQQRADALARLEKAAQATGHQGFLWAVETLRRTQH